MAIAERTKFLSKHSVDQVIEGVSFRFYSCSVKNTAPLADLIAELGGHASVLLSRHDSDIGKLVEDFEDKKEKQTVAKTTMQPINPELAEMRAASRKKAVMGAIQSLLDTKHQVTLAELLIDSLRDEYPRGEPRPGTNDLQDWINGMDVPVFLMFLTGLFRANAKMLGDLGNLFGGALATQVKDAISQAKDQMGG